MKCYSVLAVRSETAVEIHCQISAVYGKECRMSKLMVCRRVRDFKWRRTEVHDTAHTGKLSNAVNESFQNLDAGYCSAGLQKLHKRYMKRLSLPGDMWKKREFHHESARIFFNFFLPIVGKKKKVWTYSLVRNDLFLPPYTRRKIAKNHCQLHFVAQSILDKR